MLISRRKAVLVVYAVLLGGIPHAQAVEWLNFYPVTGELSVGVDGRWRHNDSGPSTREIEYEERLRLQLGGYSLDPRFFTFKVKLEPRLTQERVDSASETIRTDSTSLNYSARFSALHGLPASPVSLSGALSAHTGETEGNLGNRADFTSENREASLHWKFRPFQSTLSYTDQSLEQTFIPGFGQPPRERDEFQRTLTYRGKSRGMELLLKDNEFDDRTPQDNDYESQQARLGNNFHWGKGSNLVSRLEYYDRQGFNAEEKVSVHESLRLQHTQNLYTNYDYGYESLNRTTDTETHRGSFQANHRLYKNLDTSLKFNGYTAQSEEFQEDTYNTSLDFNYTKQVRPGVRISANLGGGYSVTDRTGGQLDFTESATIPATGIVVLTQRFIIWSTIIVTAPGCAPCLDGTDYLVEDTGGDSTQLRIPAGSPINIDDTITVDYAYQPPTVEYYGIPFRVGVRLDYGGFSFYHRTTGEDRTFISGPDPTAVTDRRTDTTGVEWKWTRGRSGVSAGAERIYTETTDWKNTEYALRQSLNYAIAPNAMLRAAFGETFLRNGTDADVYDGNVSVHWFPSPVLSVAPRLSAFHRSMEPDETASFVKAGVDVTWKWRRLAIDMLYDHTEHGDNGAIRIEDRVFVKLTRKF